MARYRRSSREPVILSTDGRVLSGLGADTNIDDTVGGKIFRWLHPAQEAAEYRDSGYAPPPATSFADVADTAITRAREAADQAGDFGQKAIKALAIAAGIGAALYAAHLFLEISGGSRRRRN